MSLLAYSGIATKVKAMRGRLFSDSQFREMAAQETVRGAVDYLQKHPAYSDIFAHIDDTRLHRSEIESLLVFSKYQDYTRLYKFANLSQRKFLDLYFMHYEITIIKRCLRNIMGHQKTNLDLSLYRDFFRRHSRIDLIRLSETENIHDFMSELSGSQYYDLIKDLADNDSGISIFDYEMRLDLLYFRTIWKAVMKRNSGKSERKFVASLFGSQLDLLNIQWIYRSIKYYSLPPEQIRALLIPFHYKLKPEQIQAMSQCSSVEEFFSLVEATYYPKVSAGQLNSHSDVEYLYRRILDRIYRSNSRKHPYTIAIVDAYLYFKESEQRKLITVIEGIRYGLNPNDIINLVAKT